MLTARTLHLGCCLFSQQGPNGPALSPPLGIARRDMTAALLTVFVEFGGAHGQSLADAPCVRPYTPVERTRRTSPLQLQDHCADGECTARAVLSVLGSTDTPRATRNAAGLRSE